MKIVKTMLIAFLLLCSMQASANIITLNFEAIVFDGTFAGQSGTGSISYDDTNLPPSGEVFLGFSGGDFADEDALTAFSFTFLGQTYSQLDDPEYPDLPLFSLFNGLADSFDFFVDDSVVDIQDNRILDFQVFGEVFDGGLRDSNNGFDFELDMYVTERTFNTVSSPATVFLLLLGLWAVFRRQPLSKFTFS